MNIRTETKKRCGEAAKFIKSINPKALLNKALARSKELFSAAKDSIASFMNGRPYKWDNRQTNLRLIITLSALFFLDYLMFCYHADKNIFSIFPEPPSIFSQREITVYLPALDGETLINEKRRAPSFENEERFVRFLFDTVAKGSVFQSTALAVPAEMNIRKIWLIEKSKDTLEKDMCAIDCEPPILVDGVKPLPASEALFRKAVEKTISENIPHITNIVLLEGGIPDKKFW
ncbi:MAG: hypothetical protein LBT84_07830 [Spirochaetia bacterium]|jgi:hypothetical protein|nr:hypothetical protein [Spirochaetia bacterium]